MPNLRDRLQALSPHQKALMLEMLKAHQGQQDTPIPKVVQRATNLSELNRDHRHDVNRVKRDSPANPPQPERPKESDSIPMVIPFQDGKPGMPSLFVIHPIGGGIDSYSSLRRYLNSDWSLYGIRAAGLEPGSTPINNMRQMVTAYIHAIRQNQPHGPYYLGGWSMGGVVAYAITQELLAQNETVGSLVLIDSPAPGGKATPEIDLDIFLRGIGFSIEQAEEIVTQVDQSEDWMTSPVAQRLIPQVLPASMTPEIITRLYRVFSAHRLALLDYLPQKAQSHDGDFPSIYFEAETQRHWFSLPHWGQSKTVLAWKSCLGGEITSYRLPCDHFGVLEEPHVLSLASDLNQFLYRVQTIASPMSQGGHI